MAEKSKGKITYAITRFVSHHSADYGQATLRVWPDEDTNSNEGLSFQFQSNNLTHDPKDADGNERPASALQPEGRASGQHYGVWYGGEVTLRTGYYQDYGRENFEFGLRLTKQLSAAITKYNLAYRYPGDSLCQIAAALETLGAILVENENGHYQPAPAYRQLLIG